jgi:hypothetical protein
MQERETLPGLSGKQHKLFIKMNAALAAGRTGT